MRADSPEESSATVSGSDEIDPKSARRAIRARANDTKRRELQQAFDQLEAYGTLTPEHRRIITQMATAIVDEILAPPKDALSDPSTHDADVVRTAVELFGPDQ